MSEVVAGNRIELLRAGTEYFPALEAACDAAQREIYLETYIFEDDATGQRIGAALARAARRGVVVELMIDGFGSKDLGDDFLFALKQAGVRVLIYRPQISPWTLRRERLRRLHRKIAVIDAKVAFVGGINIIDDMHTPRQVPPRFDYAVRVEGPLLEPIHASVVNLWTLVMWTQFRRRGHMQEIPVQAAPCGTRRGAFVVRDNVRHRNDIESAYLTAIGQATREVLIANAYFFPGISFRRALADATARGVRVVLLLQGRVEYVLLHYASRALYRYFLDAGVEIYEYHRSFLHAKVAVVDDRWSTVGSSNIDPMSLLLAREANVVIDDVDFARDLKSSLNDAMALGAVRVDEATWQRQSLPSRAMTWICYEMVRFLTGWSSYGRAREFIQ
ncbi:MAG TPA: cardiolipin synthase ClsB [Burkholderiales bacterium]|jgi:cardiolipin synthase|nr:cardiolipin synthase ClsB [Burkholderiales bacterium]